MLIYISVLISLILPSLRVGVSSHVSGMRCVFAQNHESERDSNISAFLSLLCSPSSSMDVRIYGRSTKSQLRQGGQTN